MTDPDSRWQRVAAATSVDATWLRAAIGGTAAGVATYLATAVADSTTESLLAIFVFAPLTAVVLAVAANRAA